MSNSRQSTLVPESSSPKDYNHIAQNCNAIFLSGFFVSSAFRHSTKGHPAQTRRRRSTVTVDRHCRMRIATVYRRELIYIIPFSRVIACVQMALFATALVTMAQILGGMDSTVQETTGWQAFRIFMWTSIIFDLGECCVCITAINMCTSLPFIAQQTLVLASNPDVLDESHTNLDGAKDAKLRADRLSSRYPLDLNHPVCVAARDEPLPPQLLMNHYLLLEAFGMHRGYRIVDRMVVWVLAFASFISFYTLFFWTGITEKLIIAGVTWIFTFIMSLIVLITFAVARGAGRKWT